MEYIKTVKRYFILLFCLCLVFTLTACIGDNAADEPQAGTSVSKASDRKPADSSINAEENARTAEKTSAASGSTGLPSEKASETAAGSEASESSVGTEKSGEAVTSVPRNSTKTPESTSSAVSKPSEKESNGKASESVGTTAETGGSTSESTVKQTEPQEDGGETIIILPDIDI